MVIVRRVICELVMLPVMVRLIFVPSSLVACTLVGVGVGVGVGELAEVTVIARLVPVCPLPSVTENA